MTTGEIIKTLRKQKGLTQTELGKLVGVQKNAVSKWECGRVDAIPTDTIKALATIFNVRPSYLIDDWADQVAVPTPGITDDYVSFPILGDVAAGYEHVAYEDWTGESIDVPRSWLGGRKPEDYFALRVSGDSMYPTYQDGDVVLVLRQSTMDRSGQIGVVIYDDDKATLKRVEYVMGEDWMKLSPINPQFPPVTIRDEQLEHCRVLGLPKYLIREIRD